MRRNLILACASLAIAATLAMPALVAASASFHHTVISDYCTGTNGWSNWYKVKETVSGLTTANRLTIDSKAQTRSVYGGGWSTEFEWSRKSYSFVADGSDHSLKLRRTYEGGGIEQQGRIVFVLRAWHNTSVLWSDTVRSRPCWR
jgi:hypothetical protein